MNSNTSNMLYFIEIKIQGETEIQIQIKDQIVKDPSAQINVKDIWITDTQKEEGREICGVHGERLKELRGVPRELKEENKCGKLESNGR